MKRKQGLGCVGKSERAYGAGFIERDVAKGRFDGLEFVSFRFRTWGLNLRFDFCLHACCHIII